MAIRNKMIPHVFHIIGNGKMTSIWHDTWHKNGPLSQFNSKRDIYDARLCDNDKVADLLENGEWRWPDEWYVKFPELYLFNIPTITDEHYKVVWKTKKDKFTDFKIKDVWEDMKINYPIIQWHKVIWFSQCLHRHTFIMWLALHKRLQTQDRMAKWNVGQNLLCTLCGKCSDSVQHLFFQCHYSK